MRGGTEIERIRVSNKELRQLDVWIATHLFGWVRTDVKCEPSDNRTIGGFLYSPDGFNMDMNQGSYPPHYTTDPAAVMPVLEKCVEKSHTVCLMRGFRIVNASTSCDAEASSLPIAICLFAKQLFTANSTKKEMRTHGS